MKFGRFDNEKREYVITRPDTPRPWANYLGSAEFGALVTNNAAGYTFYRSAAQGRLTRFRFNAPTADMPGKFVYLRDVDNDDVWSATWQPVGKPTETFACECRHGTGYTIVTSQYADIACETRYFIPLGARAEVWLVTLRNTGRGVRRLRAFPFIEPGCNWNALDDAQNLQYTHFIAHAEGAADRIDIGSNINMPEDADHFENKDQARHTFFAASCFPSPGANAAVAGHDCDLAKFLGPYGTYRDPDAVLKGACTGSSCTGDMPCAAFQIDIALEPGSEVSFAVFFGVGSAETAGRETQRRFPSKEAILAALDDVRDHWHSRLDTLAARTPDEAFNAMIAPWAPYNNLMTFYWSRTASLVYAGERDGLGYRDTAQDIVGASALVPEEARERLELLITGQCSSGGALPVVKPFAHRPGHEAPPARYRSDDCLWLFNAVPAFVKETGDLAFFRKTLPYADAGEATVFGHLRRALEFNLARTGAHGIPCGLQADWNDCIKLGDRGESVFVAFQLRFGLREYAAIAELLGEAAERAWAKSELAKLDAILARDAWDGDWYLRAYRDDGQTFGSAKNPEGSIFMNPQTWAVLSGHATGERAHAAMEAMHRHLATDYGIALCAPPYVTTDPTVSVARLFNPGMKENGAVFNHTQGWAVLAAVELGWTERAWEYLRNVMPASFNDRAEIREVEPYVVCQSTCSRFSPRYGAGRVSWLSGSAVWNYVAMTTGILGIRPDYAGLVVAPCIPAAWPGFTATRRFRGCVFEIEVVRGDKRAMTVNGSPVADTLIPAASFAARNLVRVTLPRASCGPA